MKKIQWVAVSVSFVLAVTLWLLVTLNRQTYTTTFSLPVKLTHFPKNFQLLGDFPKRLEVTASGPGIKLFYERLDPVKDTIEINFELFKDKGYFMGSRNLRMISGSLKQGLSATKVYPDTISLAFAMETDKKVPVRLDIEWDLPASYRVNPHLLRYQDSVLVVGPLDSLSKVTECRTVHFKMPRDLGPQTVFIPFDSLGSMKIIPNGLKLSYTPEPFTEKIMKLKVTANNLPPETDVNFDPDSVEVHMLMPLSQFEGVNHSNLFAEVSYENLNPRSPVVIPQIGSLPEGVELVNFIPSTVHYILITRE